MRILRHVVTAYNHEVAYLVNQPATIHTGPSQWCSPARQQVVSRRVMERELPKCMPSGANK